MMKNQRGVSVLSLIDVDINSLKGVTQDSRKAGDGFLFAALKGEMVDGRNYINDAVERGASVILSGENVDIDDKAVRSIVVSNPRQYFSHIVSEFYGSAPASVVAVTGTNGKSSVVHFVDQILRGLGNKSDFIGTLSGAMTTPDPVSLHEKLRDMAGDGVTNVALEASSHGLAQYRLDGVSVNVAAFTSFSQDHLDYHDDMDSYLGAKLRLFSEVMIDNGVAVLNADIPEYHKILSVCHDRNVRVISYGEKADDIKLVSCEISGHSQAIEIEVYGSTYHVKLPLVGKFQVMNALCALSCVLAQGFDVDKSVETLERLGAVPGRLQYVSNGNLHAFVDYAHTPDALKNVLSALRSHTKGRLLCVFGCGGDRDKAKRAVMGGVVSRLADVAIVTDDNPRSENPDEIRKAILSSMNVEAKEIADRRDAILFAVQGMDEDDVLLVAGKGHEQGQIFNGVTHSFDDVCEVNNALRNVV